MLRLPNPSTTTIATVLVGATVATIVAALVIEDRRTQPRREGSTHPPLPQPQGSAAEPQEGYADRWMARRARAIRRCKSDPEVVSWEQAITCALTQAYPEGAPWIDPKQGAPWMTHAAELVRSDLEDAVAMQFPGAPPTSWQAMLWLHATSAIDGCFSPTQSVDDITTCAMTRLWPTETWPAQDGWQREAFRAMRGLVLARMEVAQS